MNNKTLAQVLRRGGRRGARSPPRSSCSSGRPAAIFVLVQAVVGLVAAAASGWPGHGPGLEAVLGQGLVLHGHRRRCSGWSWSSASADRQLRRGRRSSPRLGLSKNKIYTLGEDTQKTLKGLKSTLHAYAFLTPTDRQYGVAKDLLDRYHDLTKSSFDVRVRGLRQEPAAW